MNIINASNNNNNNNNDRNNNNNNNNLNDNSMITVNAPAPMNMNMVLPGKRSYTDIVQVGLDLGGGHKVILSRNGKLERVFPKDSLF